MFSNLAPDELEVVLGAMQHVKKTAGEQVIKQGDDGDNLYVVETGKLKCTKQFTPGAEETYLKDYVPGEAFGELSLLYNAPRAASIVAIEDSDLWALDRRTFNHIVKDSAQSKREKYEEFLKNVSILETMDTYERSKLADALVEIWYEPGECVIKEGDEGNDFYLIMGGKATATKTLEPGKPPVTVLEYTEGQYFGERALLKNEPRAANIMA
jgi:cAMP-dependent protein kinase regulator